MLIAPRVSIFCKMSGVFLLISLFASCAPKPTVYDGASWEMSIDQVKALYKTEAYGNGVEELIYRKLIPGLNVEAGITYKFDASTGLKEIKILTDRLPYNIDPNDAASLFRGVEIDHVSRSDEHFFFDTTGARLLQESYNRPSSAMGTMFRYMYDRVYQTPQANIRIRLVCEHVMGYSFFDEVSFLPPGWIWSDTPSDRRLNQDTKSP